MAPLFGKLDSAFPASHVAHIWCDQIGPLLKDLGNKFSHKVAQKLPTFWASMTISLFKRKTDKATFWATIC